MAEGLDKVIAARGGSLRASQVGPVLPLLSALERSNSATEDQVFLYEWRVSINPPPVVPPTPPGVGGVTSPDDPRADACTIKGTPGDDVLTGTSRPEVICGFGGNDRISGRGGDDVIFGGLGNDRIAGGRGSDVLHGNRGRDLLLARDGVRDIVDGGSGNDTGALERTRDSRLPVEKVT